MFKSPCDCLDFRISEKIRYVKLYDSEKHASDILSTLGYRPPEVTISLTRRGARIYQISRETYFERFTRK